MSNTNKILITIVSCVFMICVASVSIVSIVTSNQKQTTTNEGAPTSQSSTTSEVSTDAPPSTNPTQTASQTTAPSQQASTGTEGSSASTTTASTTTASATTGDLATDLLGSWKDSAGLFAYEFLEGGKVNVTYFDLAGFGVPLSGTAPGLYTLEGDTLTIKFSVHVATIKDVYRISINQNELSMYDLEDHETSTFMRVS